MSGRRSRNDARRGSNGNNSSSTMLAAMFTWTKRPATVRDVVDRQQLTVPAVVRVAKGYNERGTNRFDFPTDTIYLIREVQRHQLVVARNVDSCNYVTFPRDSQLTFHLVINDNAVSPTTLTLSDLLGGSDNDDEGPCNGQRVHMSVDSVKSGRIPIDVVNGKLELVDIYSERYLIGHAFEGATLSPELKILPGYIPLTVDVAKGLTTGTDIKDYITQLLAAVESTFQSDCKATDYEEVNVFAEQPNNHYEWIEPPRPTLTTQTSVDSMSSMSSMSSLSSSSPASSVKFSNSPGSSRLMTSPETPYSKSYSRQGAAARLSLDNRRRRPLPPIPSPSADDDANQSSGRTGVRQGKYNDRDSETATGLPYEDFDEIHETRYQPHRPADRSKSYPVNMLPRSGSVDLLLDDVGCGHNVERRARLSSSHSLECLASDSPSTLTSGSASSNCSDFTFMSLPRSASRKNATTDEMTSSCETVTSSTGQKKYRPPIAAKPSPDVIKDSFRHGTNSNSMLHRQRPVVRVRRGGISSSGSNISQMSRTEILQRSATSAVDRITSAPLTTTSSLYDIHPFPGREFSRSLAADPYDFYHPPFAASQPIGNETGSEKFASSSTLAASEQNEENIYDQIASPSPLYVDMNKLKRLVSDDSLGKRKTELDNKDSDELSVETLSDTEQPPLDVDGRPIVLYDHPAPGSRRLDDVYANSDRQSAGRVTLQQQQRQQADQMPTAGRKVRKRRVKATKKTDEQTPAAAPAVPTTVPIVDNDDLYLKPFVLVQPGKVERGQGVGAETEEERNSLTVTTPGTASSTASSATSSVNVTQSYSNNTYSRTIHFITAAAVPSTGRRWVTLNEVPVDVTSLAVEDVIECLQLLNLHKYVDVFREQQIDGALLASLDEQLLINDFQFKRFDAIKLEKFACHGWRPKFSTQQAHSDC